MKNTAAIALLVARAAAQDRADMAADHAFVRPATVFQAAALEASCTDADVTTAKGVVTAAEEAWTAKVELKKTADGLVTTKLGLQTEAITALNAANPVQKAGVVAAGNSALIKADVEADLLVLTKALAMNELEVTKTAKAVELVASKAAFDTAKAADDAADTVKAAADTAVTEATKHKASIDAQVPAARAAMNASMKAWTGVEFTVDASVVWTSRAASYYEARAATDPQTAISTGDNLSALETEAYKLQALKVAVGSCTKDATPATYGQTDYTTCSSAATATPPASLVRLALRQKGVEEEKAKAEAEQTAVLDAFCVASMALGVPVTELAAGTEYRAQMLPGVRTDFAFIGDTIAKAKIDGTAPDVFATLGQSKAETASVPYVSGTNNAEKELLKCEKATKASRSYTGDANAITAALLLLPYGILTAKQALAGDGLTVGASATLETAFAAWKVKTDLATAAYDVMISTDALAATTASKACVVGGNVVATPIASAMAALVAVTASNAARPSNLVAAITATDTLANYVTACNVECAKLPSWGLKLGGADTYPTAVTEVCQGTSSSWVAGPTVACAFMSGATETGGVSAVAAVATADVAAESCWKRATAKGLLWRAAVVAAATGLDAAGGTTAGYPAVNALYTTWTGAITAWKTTREAVMDAFGNYLAEKEIVTKCGAAVLAMDVKVRRLTARLDGTTGAGGDITNEPYKKKYKADWLLAFYTTAAKTETTAAALSASYAAGYAVGTAVNTLPDVLHGRTDLEAVWLTAVAATATAKATYDAGKADYDDRIMAYDAQAALLAQATTDAGTSLTAVGVTSPTPTGTAGALATATTALGTEQTFAAYEALADDAARTATAASAYKARNAAAFAHKTAETAWTSAKNALALLQDNKADGTLSATMAAYRALQTLRTTAAGAVSATTAAIGACDTAAGVVAVELAKVNTARLAHRAAVTKCMNTKYESYKTTMSQAVAQQKTDIQTIKALLDAKVTPAAGATGARCEKGLSQGNGRAARAQPCTAETDCCGAAKGPVVPVATWADAPLMTIEICQASSAKTYSYVAPRAPMATTEPAGTDWPFACIDGASKLAAAATALATTAYMMA